VTFDLTDGKSLQDRAGAYDMTLVRVGHYLWSELRKERKKPTPDAQYLQALDKAIDNVAEVKRAFRADQQDDDSDQPHVPGLILNAA